MNNRLEVKFDLGKDGDHIVAFMYGICKMHVGDITQITYNKGILKDTYRVIKVVVKELRDLVAADIALLPKKYETLSFVWSSLEKSYKTGIPGDAKISMIYFEKHDPHAEIVSIEELAPDVHITEPSEQIPVYYNDDCETIKISVADPIESQPKKRPRKNRRKNK